MLNLFKPVSINEILETYEGDVYIINLKCTGEEASIFGIEVDGDDYNENCWICEVLKNKANCIEEVFYISNDGDRIKYCNITPEFRDYVLKELNIK